MSFELSSLEDGRILYEGFSGRFFRSDRLDVLNLPLRRLWKPHVEVGLLHPWVFFYTIRCQSGLTCPID